MRLLVTGATGILGRVLCQKLLARGFNVRALISPNQQAIDDARIDCVFGDLLDQESLLRATCNIDTVIHLAGITHTHQLNRYFEVNTEGTKNIVQACTANSVTRFIFVSSRTAGMSGGAYAQSKLEAERIVEQSTAQWLTLRVAEVYGSHVPGAIDQLISVIKKSPIVPVLGNGTYLLAPVYIDDVVDCLVNAVEKVDIQERMYIVAGPKELSYNELVDIIAQLLGRFRLKLHIPVWLFMVFAQIAAMVHYRGIVKDQIPRLLSLKSADIRTTCQDLGYQPRDILVGLKETLHI